MLMQHLTIPFLLEFLYCQIPSLLTETPSVISATTKASLKLLVSFIPTLKQLLILKAYSLPKPPCLNSNHLLCHL